VTTKLQTHFSGSSGYWYSTPWSSPESRLGYSPQKCDDLDACHWTNQCSHC